MGTIAISRQPGKAGSEETSQGGKVEGGRKDKERLSPLIDDCRLLCLRVIRVSVVNSVWQTLLEKGRTR